MAKLKEYFIVFSFGGTSYSLVELIFRKHTHWTMFVTGAVVFCILYYVFNRFNSENILKNAFLGSVMITTAEFAVGCTVNLGLNMKVWDYSGKPLNLYGQICPAFSIGWFALSIPAVYLAALLRNHLKQDLNKKTLQSRHNRFLRQSSIGVK